MVTPATLNPTYTYVDVLENFNRYPLCPELLIAMRLEATSAAFAVLLEDRVSRLWFKACGLAGCRMRGLGSGLRVQALRSGA